MRVESIGTTDEGREYVVVYVSADENIHALDALYAAVAKALATPEAQAKFKKQNYNIVPSKSVDDAKKWLANELKQWQTITAAVKIEVSP